MGRGVGRVRRTSLGEGQRQQARPILGADSRDGVALKDIGVDVVLSPAGRVRLDPSGEALGPQPPVHLPFVKVGALLPEQRRLCDK